MLTPNEQNLYSVPLTAIGRVTIQLLQLNRKDRIEERQLLLEAGIIERSPDQ